MAETTAPATDLRSSLAHAASLFEREDSAEAEDTSAVEPQNEVVEGEQPEQLADDDVADEVETVDPDVDEEEDAAAVAEPRKLKVKLPDGEVELPEDEVAKGYLRNADYTRKTQKHAEDVKAFASEKTAVSAERQQLATSLGQLSEALKRQTPEEPDWDTLRQENPSEFAEQWAVWQHHKSNLNRIEAAHRAAVEKVTADQIEHLNAHLEAERGKLVEAIPSWKDETVAKKERDAIFEFAKSAGYTDAELNQVYDSRVMVLLRKAYLFDKGQAARPKIQARIEEVRAATPGPAASTRKAPTTERQLAQKRLAKSGSVKDAAALFEQMDD